MKLTLDYPPSGNRYWRHNRGRTHRSAEAMADCRFQSSSGTMKPPQKEKSSRGDVGSIPRPWHKKGEFLMQLQFNFPAHFTQKQRFRPWTSEEDAILRALYLTHTRAEIAAIVKRTKTAVRARCYNLKLNHKHPAVTDEERDIVRSWYQSRANLPIEEFGLDELAAQLGRTKQFVSRLAGQMGLTTLNRKVGDRLRSVIGANTRKSIKQKGHPRGMLGKQHTDEYKVAHSARIKARVFTPEQVDARIKKQMATKIARYGTGNPGMLTSSNAYSRTKSGKRADLDNRFFRSAWEANYARYLNWLIEQGEIKAWEFECQTFVFHGVTRGVLTYTPDFKVYANDGSYEWHEVKGWMDAKSKAKLKRMAKFYPDEKVIVIGAKEYAAIAKWKGLIPTWE